MANLRTTYNTRVRSWNFIATSGDEARELLDLLERAQAVAERVDAARSRCVDETIALHPGESRGTDLAESVSVLALRVRKEECRRMSDTEWKYVRWETPEISRRKHAKEAAEKIILSVLLSAIFFVLGLFQSMRYVTSLFRFVGFEFQAGLTLIALLVVLLLSILSGRSLTDFLFRLQERKKG